MQLEQITPTKYRMTLHTYELATIVSAVRWIAEGADGDLSDEVIEQMEQILEAYDNVSSHLQEVNP